MNCVITGSANTAIERIKLFSDVIEADSYINLQGDEPIINLKDLKTILDYNMKFPKRIVFGKSTCNQEEFDDFSKAKVVCDLNNKLLYSSRAGIPINNKGNFIKAQRAIWLYAFNKESLNKYYEYKKGTPLEIIEDNEIIRFLEIGIDVYCVDMIGDSWAVDEKKDIEIVIQKIKDV
jgi:3-deoxy-manno-octulosonate cytidylyltransferase (CMP-KDO synthetase)